MAGDSVLTKLAGCFVWNEFEVMTSTDRGPPKDFLATGVSLSDKSVSWHRAYWTGWWITNDSLIDASCPFPIL